MRRDTLIAAVGPALGASKAGLATHAFKERNSMLKKPLPKTRRHLAGVVAVVVLVTGGVHAAWAGEAASSAKGAPILVSIKVTASDPRTNETYAAATQYLVHSGEIPAGMLDKQPLAFACKPYLPDDPAAGNRWKRIPDASNMIFIECELWDGGTKAFTPSMVTHDGRPVVVKHIGRFPGDTESRLYEMEVTATTSKAVIEAAKASAAPVEARL
jgi:hypothetical protein